MLAARAKAELARDVYPDVLSGCYTSDEIGEYERPAYTKPEAIDAEIVSETIDFSAIDAADSPEALKELAKAFKRLPEDSKAEARKRYAARMDELTNNGTQTETPA